MEIVNWIEHEHKRSDLIGWFIIHAITKIDGTIDKFETNERIEFRSDALQVEFKINGVELPFIETLNDIQKQLEAMVCERAKEIIAEKFTYLQDGLTEINSTINDMLDTARDESLKKM